MDPIAKVEAALDQTARSCLRLIVEGALTAPQYKRLSKWMFGCLNQRFTIRARVEQRGVGELEKVLQFISRACEDLIEIDNAGQD